MYMIYLFFFIYIINFQVIFVSLTPRVPLQYRVTCPKEGTVLDLLKSLSRLVDVPADRLVATDVYSHR